MKINKYGFKRSLSKFMRNYKIRTRILCVLIVFTLVPTILVFSIAKYCATEISWTQLKSHVVSGQESIEKNIELLNNQIDIFSLRMIMDGDLYYSLRNTSFSYDEKQRVLEESVKTRVLNQDIIEGVVVILKDGSKYSYSSSKLQLPYIKDSEVAEIENNPIFLETKDNKTGISYTVQARRFVEFNTSDDLGYLCVYINKDALYNVYKGSELEGATSLITDKKRQIISCKNQENIGSRLYLIPDASDETISENQFENISVGDKKMIYSCRKMKIAKNTFAPEWYLVSYIPLTGLEKTLNLLNDYILAIIAVIILISLFLAVYVSKVAIARIEKMKKNMEYFGKGDVDVQFCERETQDELWFLERSFDEMKVQIKKLIEKNNITKEHQRESELQALQAQINPHFVYNTLDSIGWMAKSKNQPEIVKMVEALASFFRISLHKGDKFITVKEEIEHVRSYIAIEEIRIPNKFTVLFDIAENILEQKILKILLQPLIENAINHGAMEKEGTCGIRINAFEMDDVLHFEVIDDGVGFDVDILNDKERMKAKSGGYAIKNVNERIKLEYGEEFGVIYSSVPGKYTRAEITLPIN